MKASSESAWMSAKINVVIIVGEHTKNILPVKSYVRTSGEQNSCLNPPDSSAHVVLSLGHWYLIACFIYLFIFAVGLGRERGDCWCAPERVHTAKRPFGFHGSGGRQQSLGARGVRVRSPTLAPLTSEKTRLERKKKHWTDLAVSTPSEVRSFGEYLPT